MDLKAAEKILKKNNFSPAWYNGRFNFPEYIALRIKADPRYKDKPDQELKRLFLSAFSWDDFQDEFLKWRSEQESRAERKTAADAERYRIDEARRNPPVTCGHCGAALAPDSKECPSCKRMVFFNNESGTWEFQEPFDFKSMFREIQKNRSENREVP
jgi:hypothetical protein